MVDASPGGGDAGSWGAAVGLPHGTAPACGRFPAPTPVNNTGATNLPRAELERVPCSGAGVGELLGILLWDF